MHKFFKSFYTHNLVVIVYKIDFQKEFDFYWLILKWNNLCLNIFIVNASQKKKLVWYLWSDVKII